MTSFRVEKWKMFIPLENLARLKFQRLAGEHCNADEDFPFFYPKTCHRLLTNNLNGKHIFQAFHSFPTLKY
jgi:hypothetical protein